VRDKRREDALPGQEANQLLSLQKGSRHSAMSQKRSQLGAVRRKLSEDTGPKCNGHPWERARCIRLPRWGNEGVETAAKGAFGADLNTSGNQKGWRGLSWKDSLGDGDGARE